MGIYLGIDKSHSWGGRPTDSGRSDNHCHCLRMLILCAASYCGSSDLQAQGRNRSLDPPPGGKLSSIVPQIQCNQTAEVQYKAWPPVFLLYRCTSICRYSRQWAEVPTLPLPLFGSEPSSSRFHCYGHGRAMPRLYHAAHRLASYSLLRPLLHHAVTTRSKLGRIERIGTIQLLFSILTCVGSKICWGSISSW